jgi:hypothetical protein
VSYFGGTECENGEKDGKKVSVCKKYCQEDGCNSGNSISESSNQIATAALWVLAITQLNRRY